MTVASATRIRLGSRSELAGGPPRRFDIGGHRIVLVSVGAELFALDDTCTHEEASLAAVGEVDADAGEIECCRHGARFSVADGSVASLPATAPLRTYLVVLEDDEAFVEFPT